MKNKNYIGKKTIYIILAAAIFLFGNGNKKVVSFAEEITAQEDIVILEQEEISENGEQEDLEVSSNEQEEYNIKFANDKEENITLDSVSTGAITITSGGGLKVEPLSIRVFEEKYNTNGKHLKLNFSYQLLGCVKVDSYLNVREERSTDAEIAGKLSNNTFCDVLEIYRDGWVKIKSGKVCGYVSAEYLLVGERAEEIAEKFHIKDINFIKPGIGETTRVLLRRVPWKVLVSKESAADPCLASIKQLAKEKGVPVEYYPLKNYKACGIIKELSDV